MLGLGTCEKCQGPLCVSGKMVACERCGHEVPDHPIIKEEAVGLAKLPRQLDIPPSASVVTWLERIAALEKQHKTLAARVQLLESRQQGSKAKAG